jgi:hypothetical protein
MKKATKEYRFEDHSYSFKSETRGVKYFEREDNAFVLVTDKDDNILFKLVRWEDYCDDSEKDETYNLSDEYPPEQITKEYVFNNQIYSLQGEKNEIKYLQSDDGSDVALIVDRDDNILFEISADCNQNYGFLKLNK